MNSMKLTYDDRVGAAYIRLQTDEDSLQSAAQKVVRLSDSAEADDVVVLDLDDAGEQPPNGASADSGAATHPIHDPGVRDSVLEERLYVALAIHVERIRKVA